MNFAPWCSSKRWECPIAISPLKVSLESISILKYEHKMFFIRFHFGHLKRFENFAKKTVIRQILVLFCVRLLGFAVPSSTRMLGSFCSPHHLLFWKLCKNIKIKRLRTKLEIVTFIFILRMTVKNSDTNFVHTFFLMKSRFLVENSTPSCFESLKTVNFQHIHCQNVWKMFCSNEKLFQ